MTTKINKLVLNFIAQIHESKAAQSSYWFAQALLDHFVNEYSCDIVYDISKQHFGCMIGDYVYDITGEVSEQYNWVLWEVYMNNSKEQNA